MSKTGFSSLACIAFTLSAHAELLNGDQITEQFHIQNWHNATQLKTTAVKIAILDNGFSGFVPSLTTLPANTVLVDGTVNAQAPTPHGLAMAEIIWATMNRYPHVQMTLVNTNGFSNFKRAIDYVIENKIDVVLYSQVWSFGGNFNGHGLIDAQVSRATNAGILWVNAAGNFGSKVYDQSLNQALKDELTFIVQKTDTPTSLTLSWNDFSDQELEATNQDLDFQVLNLHGDVITESALRQSGVMVARGSKGVSGYAREKITLKKMDLGEYRIKIKNVSNNFNAKSRVRILIESTHDAVNFSSATPDREIFPPADHPAVFTVGEDSLISSRSMSGTPANKPDLVLPTFGAKIAGAETPVRGSSVSAAVFSGIVAMMKVLKPTTTKNQILRMLRSRTPVVQADFGFVERNASEVPESWRGFFRPEMKLAQSPLSGQTVILVPYDPKDIMFSLPVECKRTKSPWAPMLYSPIRVKEFLDFK